MWSAAGCKKRALVFKLTILLAIGMSGYAMYAIGSMLAFAVMPIATIAALLAVYWTGFYKPAKHLKEFENWARKQTRAVSPDHK